MAKRPIQRIDLVPDWLRHTIAAETEQPLKASAPREQGFKVVDPFAPDQKGGTPMVRRIKAEYYEDPDNGSAVVQLAWEGTTPPVLEFYKKYSSAADAEIFFSSMLKELRQIESYVDTNPNKAKEKTKDLFDEYKGQSDIMNASPAGGTGTRTNTSLHQELAAGWNILNKQGKLVVDFEEAFLKNIFASYKEEATDPIQPGELIYTTSNRLHCGADNFVASYWRKVKTADGNILRNAALVSRIGGESYFITNVPVEDFTLLCAALTPDPVHYGITYDSFTGKWCKTAAVVERYFSDPNHPEELDRILDYLGKGKKKPEEKLEDKSKDEKKKGKSDEEKKLDDLLKEGPNDNEESLPLAGEGETASLKDDEEGNSGAQEDLMNLLKKEAQDKGESK